MAKQFTAHWVRIRRSTRIALILLLVVGAFIVSFRSTDSALNSCTIFNVSRDGQTFFCNNEDEGLRQGRVWFLPGTPGQYGLVLFCYGIQRNVMIPVGGMNDQGLCLDGTVVEETAIHLDPTKPDYLGTFSLEMLRVCATVEEAKSWVNSWDLLMLHWQQVHIADQTGDAVVVGLDSSGSLWLTNKTADYLISVPINHAQNTEGFGDRYDFVETRLNAITTLTLDDCRAILQVVSVSTTMYSYICDQQNGILYLYSRGDFERVAVLNIAEELAKGEHSYDIERLVSQQSGYPSPVDTLNDTLGLILVTGISLVAIVIGLVMFRRQRRESRPPSRQ